MKIDLHTHILPPEWPDMEAISGYGGWPRLEREGDKARISIDGRLFREVCSSCWEPSVRLADCDRDGVDVQVLSTVPVMFSYGHEASHALVLARFLNDHVASVASSSARFLGLGTVPLQSPELAIAELERCVLELGLSGVQIGTHVNHWNLDDEALFPFFRRASELGAAVFVHPWDMMAKDRMTRYFLPWLVGMPAETALAIASMIFGGVLEYLPDLRVCFAHGGGAFPMTVGRLDRAWEARPDLCREHITQPPRAYVRRIYVDSLVHDASVLRYLIGLFGADRIALGSDYPFPLGEERVGALVESMGLTAEEREWILGGTARAFLGVEEAVAAG